MSHLGDRRRMRDARAGPLSGSRAREAYWSTRCRGETQGVATLVSVLWLCCCRGIGAAYMMHDILAALVLCLSGRASLVRRPFPKFGLLLASVCVPMSQWP